ncbi:NnrS family protein [Hyphomicrobium sp. GJ21]|uniref:NnrS family protein n=1 Tax=Hyphomicrobium sp. GJ21 TaxID=113574 RepID=UPI000622BE68|nr:NnrS family protein [Hyphomicrobium sp. GJ21]CEJ86382.1 NnrS family protein [Hyphomicrobium sp. GJ21]
MSAAVAERPLPGAKVAVQPLFLAGALYAVLMMALWVPWFLGFIQVPSAWPVQAWFLHELAFGFAPIIVAGALLTASAGDTSRKPVSGAILGSIFLLWLAGRIGMGLSAHLAPWTIAALSVAFPIALAVLTARVQPPSGGWRGLAIVALLLGLGAADALFHYEMFEFGRTKSAADIALAFALLLLVIIAGRVVSSPKRRPTIFYAACGFVVLGSVLAAVGVLWDDYDFASAGLNAWTVGSIGTLALAIATWASRARRSPTAFGTIALYVLAVVSGLAATAGGLYPQWTLPLLPISGIAWIAAFAGFAALYGRAVSIGSTADLSN